MSLEHPNHVHLSQGETNVGASFGPLSHVTPIHFGAGHEPHVEARFRGGLRLTMTPDALTDLIREGQEAIAKLPQGPTFWDATGVDE